MKQTLHERIEVIDKKQVISISNTHKFNGSIKSNSFQRAAILVQELLRNQF